MCRRRRYHRHILPYVARRLRESYKKGGLSPLTKGTLVLFMYNNAALIEIAITKRLIYRRISRTSQRDSVVSREIAAVSGRELKISNYVSERDVCDTPL